MSSHSGQKRLQAKTCRERRELGGEKGEEGGGARRQYCSREREQLYGAKVKTRIVSGQWSLRDGPGREE